MANKPPPRRNPTPSLGGGMVNIVVPAPEPYVPPVLAGPPRTLKPQPVTPVTVTPASTSSSPASSPPPPAPVLPNYKPAIITNKNFKVAPSDIIQFDDSSIEIALITDMLFEDIGATELANISRSDLIDGQSVIYAPIRNLPTIRREFNPNNIVATAHDSDYFSRFAIDLSLRGMYDPYFNNNGDLIIEIETVGDNEEIQVQVLTNGTIDLVEII